MQSNESAAVAALQQNPFIAKVLKSKSLDRSTRLSLVVMILLGGSISTFLYAQNAALGAWFVKLTVAQKVGVALGVVGVPKMVTVAGIIAVSLYACSYVQKHKQELIEIAAALGLPFKTQNVDGGLNE